MSINIDGIIEQGKYLKLTKDITLTDSSLDVSKYSKLDLNGFTLTSADKKYAVEVNNGKVNICNGKIRGYRGIAVDAVSDVTINSLDIEVEGRALGVYDGSNVTISKDSILHTITTDCTVLIIGDKDLGVTKSSRISTLYVNGTVINDSDEKDLSYAISGNGLEMTGVNITLSKTAVVQSKYTAIFLSFKGKTVINGSSVVGATAIAVKGGQLYANNASILGNGTKASFTEETGFNPTGDAIAIVSTNYPAGLPVVSIKNCDVNSEYGKSIATYAYSGYEPVSKIVESGNFKPVLDDTMLKDGCISLDNGLVIKVNITDYKFFAKELQDKENNSKFKIILMTTIFYNFKYDNINFSDKFDFELQDITDYICDDENRITEKSLIEEKYSSKEDIYKASIEDIKKYTLSKIYSRDIQEYVIKVLSDSRNLK